MGTGLYACAPAEAPRCLQDAESGRHANGGSAAATHLPESSPAHKRRRTTGVRCWSMPLLLRANLAFVKQLVRFLFTLSWLVTCLV